MKAPEAPVPSGIVGGGQLPGGLKTKFEASLGVDLSSVRVHTGDDSARAAESVGARAYAIGADIHFGAGEYDPGSSAGQELIAHEVAHTVQQRGGSQHAQYKLDVSQAGDALEVEADHAAAAMVTGAPATVSAGGLAIARKGIEKGVADKAEKLSKQQQVISKLRSSGWTGRFEQAK